MPSRRDFLGTTASLGVWALSADLASARKRGTLSTLKVGLVGCGGRGTGAAVQALAADPGAVLWAMGDVFDERIETCLGHVRGSFDAPGKVDTPEERRFTGFDACERVIGSGVDVVLLCTPPAFRPGHLAAAVKADKHVFCEKPVAVDAPGVRSVLDSARAAESRSLSLMSGFCWRYHDQMREVFTKILEGGIGRVRAVQCTYNTTGWVDPKPMQDGWSETEFQLRNWHYFHPISGDHVVEQAVHAIDWINWAMGGEMPVRCTAVGGRSARPDAPETGNVWDNFGVTYDFANGARAYHMCRHWPNTPADNTAYMIGTRGDCRVMPWRGLHVVSRPGSPDWKGSAPANDMYQREHDELFASIRAGTPVNDGVMMANSTLLAIMARQAAYTGQAVTWDQITQSTEQLNPEPWDWGDRPRPSVAVPGETRFV